MGWYDYFSYGYDIALEGLYSGPRAQAASTLEPGVGHCVVDLACGTGLNFPHLLDRLGPDTSRLVGVDASAGMLQGAQRRVERSGWPRVHLLEADARSVDAHALQRTAGEDFEPDYVFCSLGLTALPDWKDVFRRFFGLLRPGGQFLILDVAAERWVPQTSWVQLIARADLSRKVWEPLEAASRDFELHYLPGSPHIHGGRLFIATGFKDS